MARYYDDYDWDVDGFPGEYVFGDDCYVADYYMDERWKPVRHFPGYWVSNKARVYSNTSNTFIYGTPLRSGHIDITLHRNGQRYHKYLHRMVAEAFIPNPTNLPIVRHLNDNQSENEPWNLDWGTQLDNVHDCIRNGNAYRLSREDIERANAVRRTPIVAECVVTGKLSYFISQQEAARVLRINQSSINAVLHGRRKTAGGYIFFPFS